jgi:hypothetical protein
MQKVLGNLKEIVSTGTKDVAMIASAGDVSFKEDGQNEVCDAFHSVSRLILENLGIHSLTRSTVRQGPPRSTRNRHWQARTALQDAFHGPYLSRVAWTRGCCG